MAGSTTIVDKDGTALGTGSSPFVFKQKDAAGNDVGLAPIGPRKRTRGLIAATAAIIAIPAGTKAASVYCSILSHVGVGSAATPASAVQERQTITGGDATSGNLKANFQGQASANLAFNVSGANYVAGLVALSSIGAGGVTLISGGPLNTTPIVIEFAAGILDGDQPMITHTTVDLAGGVDATSRLPTVLKTTAASNVLGFVSDGAELMFPLATGDAYIYIKSDSATATGVYRCTWLS